MPGPRFSSPAGALLGALLASVLAQACAEQQRETPVPVGAPRVILIIGDGMGDQQITIARNYLVGSGGRLTLDDLPFRGAAQVQTIAEDDPSRPVYVADSANTATAMATGELTSSGRIATTAKTDQDIVTILELASAAGLGTGIVTTSSVTDATPASFVAHISQRFCQGPSSMVLNMAQLQRTIDCSQDYKGNGGKGSIAEQIAASQVDIVLGGGTQHFDQPMEGDTETTVIDAALANGYTVIRTQDELASLSSDTKVLGAMPSIWVRSAPVRW